MIAEVSSSSERLAKRVWLLTNAPSPYQAELFTAVTTRDDVDLTVRFMRSSSTSGRAVESRFEAVTMAALLPERIRDEVRLHPRALWESAFGSFDAYVLSGLYTSVTFLCCAVILTFRGKPWSLWLERPHRADSPTYRSRTSLLGRLRDSVRSWLLSKASRVICMGTAARDEYRNLGVPAEHLDVLPYCCDLERYDQVTIDQIRQWRSDHGLDGATVFLFSGQMIPRKGVDTLLAAFSQLADEEESTVLLLLGDGPQRCRYEEQIEDQHHGRVQFLGHLPQEELPIVFRAADVFVFPSRHDGWAVVINEACAARLPIIATLQTGAVHDLVQPNENGARVEAGDIEGFYSAMKAMAQSPEDRHRMGKRSRELVEQFSPTNGAVLFAEAIHRSFTARTTGAGA